MSYHVGFNGHINNPTTFHNPHNPQKAGQTASNNPNSKNFSQPTTEFPRTNRDPSEFFRDFGRDNMFFNDCFFNPQDVFPKPDEGEEGTLRGRPLHPHAPHPGYPAPPPWVEDQELGDLANRMSHTPHFATVPRRGHPGAPWRERRHSGESGMSASDDNPEVTTGSQWAGVPHEIPIRFEAPPPPSAATSTAPPQVSPGGQDLAPGSAEGAVPPQQAPTRTTSAVDATENAHSGNRTPRCASAPPDMNDKQQQQQQQQQQEPQPTPQPQRFVSKISITPQAPGSPPQGTSPPFSPLPAKFNTVPRPFVPDAPQGQPPQYAPQQYPPQQFPPQQYPQQPPLGFYMPPEPPCQYPQQYQQYPETQNRAQRPSVVRNIPIFVEGRDEPVETTPPPPPPQPQPPQPPQPQPTPRNKRQQQPQQQQQPIPHAVPMPMPESSPAVPSQEDPTPEEPTETSSTAEAKPGQDRRLVEIEKVRQSVADLSAKVDEFKGTKKDRSFLYLDEMLTRALLQLDNVDPDGNEDVRQKRKAVIRDINLAITKLESLATDTKTTTTTTADNTPTTTTTTTAAEETEGTAAKEEKKEEKEASS